MKLYKFTPTERALVVHSRAGWAGSPGAISNIQKIAAINQVSKNVFKKVALAPPISKSYHPTYIDSSIKAQRTLEFTVDIFNLGGLNQVKFKYQHIFEKCRYLQYQIMYLEKCWYIFQVYVTWPSLNEKIRIYF